MSDASLPSTPPANDAGGGEDIREQLRGDHERALAGLDGLRAEADERRAATRLRELRRAWIIHALAEETVVYRALESAEGGPNGKSRADERFVEHELVGGLFDKLLQTPPGSLEWKARIAVVKDLVARHIDAEHGELFERLERRFDAPALRDLGRQFESARDKLTMLERAKAA